MASNKTISIGFRIEDGKDGFRKLVMDADALGRAMRSSVVEAEKLHGKLINFAALDKAFGTVSDSLAQINGVLKDLTGAYSVQMEAERQLEQVMRNTMAARDEDIQSIKDFCSAQQQLGVVGDEVQLAGAQELATYLELNGSLKTLIPVMNDMVAQQYGYSHTAENAAQIATMLGKVMQGQTSALSRLGYSFDEAQEKVLKYGTESERAAVLAEVVGQSVGGMNAKLAQTDTGRMKQLENSLGDLKEKLGEMAMGAAPVIEIGANAAIACMGVLKLVKGIRVLVTVLKAAQLAAGGIGIALAAVSAAVVWLTSQTDEAAGSLQSYASAQDRAARASEFAAEAAETEADARKGAVSSIELNISRLKEFNGTKAEETRLVREMNAAYGSTMGYFSTVAQWYEALTANSKAYCEQMVIEARIRKQADRIADLEIKRDSILRDEQGAVRVYSKKRDTRTVEVGPRNAYGAAATRKEEIVGSSDWEKAAAQVAGLNLEIAALKGNMGAAARQAAAVKMEIRGLDTEPLSGGVQGGTQKNVSGEDLLPEGSLAWIRGQIASLDKLISVSLDPQASADLARRKEELRQQAGELELAVRILYPGSEWEGLKNELEKDPLRLTVEADISGMPDSLAGLEENFWTVRQRNVEGFCNTLGKVSDIAGAAGAAFRGMGQAFEAPALDIVGIMAGAIAQMVAGYAAASSQSAGMGPFGWLAFSLSGLATLMTMITQVKSAAKFADGGIVSGPTMALVGEYAGAANNPEVIAPLSKLRDIIGHSGAAAVVVGGEIRVKGRDLAIALKNEQTITGLSGRK